MDDFFSKDNQLFSALIATFTTILVFLIKEWSDGRRKKKQESKETLDVFKLYGEPLALAVRSMAFRLKEIFQYNARYFRSSTPPNEKYRYHYVSTLYRLCSVMGWIRAASREQASLDVADKRFNLEIDRSLKAFQSALSENKQINGSLIQFLCQQWELSCETAEPDDMSRWEEKIDSMVWKALDQREENTLHEIHEEPFQLALINEVAEFLAKVLEHEPVSVELLNSNKSKAYGALGQKEAWIFRDWQFAIGDMMIRENNSEFSPRRLEVIGYREFEDLFLKLENDPRHNRWIERVDRLFRNLNLSSDDRIDARPQQLKNILSSLVNLLQILENADQSTDLFTAEEVLELQEFDRALNPDWK